MLAGRAVQVVRHPRARALRLRLDRRSGAVILTLPPRAGMRDALAWARSKEDWVRGAVDEAQAPMPICAGMSIPYCGGAVRLVHAPQASRVPHLVADQLIVGGAAAELPGRVIRWLKRAALDLLTRETAEFAALVPVTVAGVGVGDPVSRWGSCAASGKIRYSWRLILAPANVRRATVAHEVAHRVHMNHSPAFHAQVAQLLGHDPKAERAWLRAHGPALQRWGMAVPHKGDNDEY
ncbi:MAG: M48 family metallopeptidase [Alphaproteobacteria bacterium]|nr:M48 family metallopeptidase [Alphaproteobacteria bacterium]MDE2042030.1 DUF45 domain-containing protein [Alphaproteobacteria bacterium]MDE2340976.1 DUF45 domain-containing protein [Alphaproteobacteria bacterium]